MTDADKERLKRMIKRGYVSEQLIAKFRDIFLNEDMKYCLDYQDPDLEDREVSDAVTKEILEGIVQQVGMSLDELIKTKQILEIPVVELGCHLDDANVNNFDQVEIEDISHEEYPEYYNMKDKTQIPFVDDDILHEAEKVAGDKGKKVIDELFTEAEKEDVSHQSDALKDYLRRLREQADNRPLPLI